MMMAIQKILLSMVSKFVVGVWDGLDACEISRPEILSQSTPVCGDIYDNQGLCSFQTLRTKFCLPASAYFVFLQLRSALKAYGFPWASSISSHPMRDWIAPSAVRPSVSLIYNKIIDCITKTTVKFELPYM